MTKKKSKYFEKYLKDTLLKDTLLKDTTKIRKITVHVRISMETITDSVKMYFSINIIDCDEHNKANCKNLTNR